MDNSKHLSFTSKLKKWPLVFLYAPVRSKGQKGINYPSTFYLGMYMAQQKLQETGVSLDYSWSPGKFYPDSVLLESVIADLENQNLIIIESDTIKLTTEGVSLAKPAYEKLPADQKQLLSWIKGKHVYSEGTKFISFMHMQYPQAFEKSKEF